MSAPSDTASSNGSEIDAEVFGPLATISEDALIALATRIGSQVLHVATDNAKLVRRIAGSYNIVHVIQLDSMKLVIRVPATGWGAGMTKIAADALASQVATIRLVRQKTEAPVPEVYDWDPTNNNEISAPFIYMAFLPGEPASRVWFDQSNEPEAREELRLNILSSLLLEVLIRNSPDLDSYSRFVLRPPDFDSQNILMDGKGNVTGTIDWDFCQTIPPHQGYARYPGWITRDWDPLMYGWPHLQEYEDSSDTLQRYRDYYSKELGKAMSWKGDWKFTKNSQIAEAVWITILNPLNRMEICQKFVHVAFNFQGEFEAMDVLDDIDDDLYSKEYMNELESRLKLLVCPPDTLPQSR
ncbi:altered inheritance of mitochondria mitochondrial [Fusarium heterosporum]|uniref:Altered inheritance of mitochondria mitochondrial n=1 Tax=Fusarium heterosporum TaxID=42747 RepID=A0A8H5TPK9_FUSHE|nr:altered inheritance of mitochondria mitochondrial [Fusarium heterosporum]